MKPGDGIHLADIERALFVMKDKESGRRLTKSEHTLVTNCLEAFRLLLGGEAKTIAKAIPEHTGLRWGDL